MALLGALAAPSSLFCQLARRKDNRWSAGRRFGPFSSRQRRHRSLDRALSKSLWTGSGGDGHHEIHRHPLDLHDFKNEINLSVADYLNIESKWSPFLNSDLKRKKKYPVADFSQDSKHFAGSRWPPRIGDADKFPSLDPKPFSVDSLRYPFKDKTTLGVDPIISSPSLPDHHDDPCLLQRGSHPNILDTSSIDMRNLLNLMEGDLFILELFEKNILMNDDRASKLPMLVLSHPKLFNGLVMNPIDVHELASNPRIWAPILIPQSVASILSSLNEKESVLVDLFPGKSLDGKNSPDRVFPAATVFGSSGSRVADDAAPENLESAEEKTDAAVALPAFHSSTQASSDVPSVSDRRRVGVIRRLTSKEILRWIRSSHPHLQRTVDAYKYADPEGEESTKAPRYPILETKVAALLPSSPRGGNGRFVREGNDCVSLFDETNFFSDEYHCQSADSGLANWGVDGELRIFDVESVDGFVLHFGFVDRGTLTVGDRIHLKIDDAKRSSISANHTSAHLLNFGLDQVFFPDSMIRQGDYYYKRTSRVSRVQPDALIMEFEANDGVKDAEIAKIENLVNLMIYHKVPVYRENVSIDEAKSLNIPLLPPVDPVEELKAKDGDDDNYKFSFQLDPCASLAKPYDIFTACWSGTELETSLVSEAPSSSSDGNDSCAAMEGVTVVSVGIPASDVLRSNNGGGNPAGVIGACSLEACSGTHVPDTSHIRSFVVTEVERLAEGRSRVKAVSKDDADSVLRNADMISSHLDALEAESSAIENKQESRDFGEKLDAVSRSTSSLPLPATARSSFLRRLEALSLVRAEREATVGEGAGVSSSSGLDVASGLAQRWTTLPTTVAEDVTRQLVDKILELGVNRPAYHVQQLRFSHPKLVKNGLLLAARQIARLNDHRPRPLAAAFFLTQTRDRTFCLSFVRGDDAEGVGDKDDKKPDVGDGGRCSKSHEGVTSASEWMRRTLAAVDVPFIGGAVNRELSEDRFFFAAVKSFGDVFDGSPSVDVERTRDRRSTSLSQRIEVEATKIIEQILKV